MTRATASYLRRAPRPVLELLGTVGVDRIAPVFTEFGDAWENLGRKSRETIGQRGNIYGNARAH